MKTLLVLLFCLPLGVYAQIWHADANIGGPLTHFQSINFQDCETTSNNPQIFQENINGVIGKVWRQTCPAQVKRNEFSRPIEEHFSGQTIYYAWRVMLSHSDNFNDRFAIFQFKTSEPDGGSQNHPITIAYENGKILFQYFKPCKNINTGNIRNWKLGPGCSSENRKFILKEIPTTKDTWIDIVLGIKKGIEEIGNNAGTVEVWINGIKQTLNNPNGAPSEIVECKTDDDPDYNDNIGIDERSVYAKFGIYGGGKCPWDITSRIHNLKAFNDGASAVQSLNSTIPQSRTLSTSDVVDFGNEIVMDKFIKVFPNPVNDSFTINLENIQRAKVTITDLLGKTVYRTTTENPILELDKDDRFKSGMYIISVKDEFDKIYTSKLIIK
ncbi:T9SS type A sorting domain-containing protein [Litoribaculum gwangyangense]|uniref:Secretion system C-terminal sorting domain-containing protein n=1 Tax=Litoribaculum gwangyangense TaxID=1130722 RepID=A0ABP9CNF0_9FLAO